MEQIVKLTTYTPQNEATFEDGKIDPNMDSINYATQTKKSCGTKTGIITSELLDVFLYGKRKIQGIDLENAKRQKVGQEKCVKPLKCCDSCRKQHNGPCHMTEPQKSIRQVVGNAIHDITLTYAVLSFPAEVQLCTSSIPGYTYGVSAKLPFPIGTWIGPYEGKRVKAEEITTKSDSNYVWEIYEDGKFSHYLDGNDENNSSWMRFIRCARHKDEQNMVVFQYGNNIYYRAVRDINAGTELLVWYNNNYTQFLGVPLGLRNVPGCKNDQDKNSAQTSCPVPQAEVKPVLKERNIDLNHTAETYTKKPVLYSPNKSSATTVTYCYSASKPALQPISYSNGTSPNNMNIVKPTVTVEHKPALINGIKSRDRTTSPGNEQRQQHMTRGPSPGTDVGNYFTFSPRLSSPSTCSTSSISIACEDRGSPREDRGSPREDRGSPRENHASPRENHISPRENHASPRENHISPRENHISPREHHAGPYENHTSPRGEISPRENENPDFYKPPEKPYQCGHCSSSFAQPSELSAHVVTHTNDRPFKCGFCGRSFAGASTLYNHMRTHTGNRAFLCNKCGCTLDTATQLSRHMRTPGECPKTINVTREVVPPYSSTLARG